MKMVLVQYAIQEQDDTAQWPAAGLSQGSGNVLWQHDTLAESDNPLPLARIMPADACARHTTHKQ